MEGESILIELSPVGRVFIAPDLPARTALFYTSVDFDGRLNGDSVSRLRAFLRDRFSIDAPLSTCHQIHSANVERAGSSGVETWCELDSCDALWTDQLPGALGIKVADCLPVSLIDQTSRTAANIHAGWKGSAANIVGRTIAILEEKSEFRSGRAQVWLGPSIRQCCFEVGEEVVEKLRPLVPEVESFLDRSRGERPYLDLVGVNRRILQRAGVPDGAVWDSGLCTRCDGRLHSWRRDGAAAGRVLSIIALG
jgi:YfiH family protein